MAITWPRALDEFNNLLPKSASLWRVHRTDEFAGMTSAQTIPIEMADPIWAVDFDLDKCTWSEARVLQARLNALQGSFKTFYLTDPMCEFPAADPGGVILGTANVTIHTIDPTTRDAVRFAGLPAGYVLTEGDKWSVNFGSGRRACFSMLETVTASGAGITPLAQVLMPIHTGITTTLQVTLIRPSAKFRVAPNSLDLGKTRHGSVDASTFSALQVI